MGSLCLSIALLAAAATSEPATQEAPASLAAKLTAADAAQRRAAEKALKDLGAAAVGALVELAKSGDANSQAAAAYVLGTIGPKAAGASSVLCELLAGGQSDVRIQAAVALGRIGAGADGAPAALVSAFASEEWGLRRAASWALWAIGKPAAGELVRGLKSGNILVRQWSAHALRDVGKDAGEAVDGLCELLKTETDWGVRRQAMLALSQIGPAASKAAGLLAETMGKEPHLRRLAGSALGAINADPNAALPELLKAMESPDPMARRDALGVVSRVGHGSPAARKLLSKMVSDDSSAGNRLKAAFVLADLDPNAIEVVPVLLEALARQNQDRERAIWVSRKFAEMDARLVPAIAAVLDDAEDEDIRAEATWALGDIGKPAHRSLPRIVKQLSDPAEAPRAAAACCLGKFGRDANSAIPELTKLLDDSSMWVRSQAGGALHKMGVSNDRVVAAVTNGLRSPKPWARADAAELLISFGPAAKSAAGELEKMLGDEDNYPRVFAAAALHAVDPANPKGLATLLSILKERRNHPWFKRRTCELLGDLEAKGPQVEAALEEVVRTGDREQRKAAEESLKKIKGKSK